MEDLENEASKRGSHICEDLSKNVSVSQGLADVSSERENFPNGT